MLIKIPFEILACRDLVVALKYGFMIPIYSIEIKIPFASEIVLNELEHWNLRE